MLELTVKDALDVVVIQPKMIIIEKVLCSYPNFSFGGFGMIKKYRLSGLVAAVLATITLVGAMQFTQVDASAKTKVRYYQNIKNRTALSMNAKAPVYSTARLTHKKGTLHNFPVNVTQYYAAHVTRNGKPSVYYKIKSGSKTGWVWRGWLMTVKGATNPTSQSGQKKQPSTPVTSKQKKEKAISASDIQSEMLTQLNAERTKRGLTPLTIDNGLQSVADTRAPQVAANFSHYDADGNGLAEELAKQQGVNYHGECIAYTPLGSYYSNGSATAKAAAQQMLYMYIYDDAASNWGHRDLLLDPSAVGVGMGIDVVGTPGSEDYAVYNAIDLN